MKKKKFVLIAMSIFLVLGGIKVAKAEIELCGPEFTVTGFLRYEVAAHVGHKNPNNASVQDDYNHLNFSHTWFQTEWNYKPSDQLKLFAKVRLRGDQTQAMDSALEHNYNAFPVDVHGDRWTMMRGQKDKWRAEVWELYGDYYLENLWLRVGKQQVVWGEMIGGRVLDSVNSLDNSLNFQFEPEEFESIRIPNWMIRATYQWGTLGKLVNDAYTEIFVNPGDVVPDQFAELGAPFRLFPAFPSALKFKIQDRRGDVEFGARVGGMIKGGVFLTLNYLYTYNDGMLFQFDKPLPGRKLLWDIKYPLTHNIGMSANYYIATNPINTVVTFEGLWTPDQPYSDATVPSPLMPAIRDWGTFKWACRLDRTTFLLPTPFSAAALTLQFTQKVYEGDPRYRIGGATGATRYDKLTNTITCQVAQKFHHDDYQISCQFAHDFTDATFVKPMIKIRKWTDVYIDVYGIYLCGNDKRAGKFSALTWAQEVVFRVTYQF